MHVLAALLASTALVVGGVPTFASAATGSQGCGDVSGNGLGAAAIIPGTREGWAAGSGSTILRHAHGWHRVPVAESGVTFLGITAPSRRAVFAVGYRRGYRCAPIPVMEHYQHGSFNPVHLPSLGHAVIRAIASSGPRNIWAVGNVDRDPIRMFVLHYDGSRWARIGTDIPARKGTPFDVATSGPQDVWVLNTYAQGPELLHYDGESWINTPWPGHGKVLGGPQAISATPTDTWAVGLVGRRYHRIAYHWVDEQWVATPMPDPRRECELESVTMLGQQGIAVGGVLQADNNYTPCVVKYSSGRWHQLAATHDHPDSDLRDVALSTKFRFAVGSWAQPVGGLEAPLSNALIEQPYKGVWRPVRVPS